MEIGYTEAELELQAEIAAYLSDLVTPELERAFSIADFDRATYRELVSRLGRDGWLALGWPREYGGQGRTAIEQYIFFNEARKFSLPVPYLTINSVAPAIMRFGSDEQKQKFLPEIARGEHVFAIGYTEPAAGTDLAALSTRAIADGDEYVITGQKLFTSLAHLADTLWLAVRTGPGKGREGISLVTVPIDTPGVSMTPIETVGDYRTNAVYLDEARVPRANLVGAEGDGWKLLTGQLDYERVALSNPGYIEKHVREVHRWARAVPDSGGERPIESPSVREALARGFVRHEQLKLLNWELASAVENLSVQPQDASVVKVFGTEVSLDVYELLMDAVGTDACVRASTAGTVLHTDLERAYRRELTFTFGGGANEVQRQIIARRGLGLAGRGGGS